MTRLTAITVRTAAAGLHGDGNGLYLRVKDTGTRSWLVRITTAGKRRDIGIGSAGVNGLTLAQAREQARAMRSGSHAAISPRAAAKAAADAAKADAARAVTFAQFTDTFIEGREEGWRNTKHRQQWRNTLSTYAHPHIGHLAVSDIDTSHILSLLQPIWSLKPETASRVRGRIERILSAAKVLGLRSGDNPAAWRGHLDQLLPKPTKLAQGHHAALHYSVLPAFLADLRTRPAVSARALELLILTAARTSEITNARWAEIDIANAIWRIPANRMKAGRPHEIPLTPNSLALLQNMRSLGDGTFVFPSSRPARAMSNMAMAVLLRRMGQTSVTVHGFRSTFRDWAGETTAFPREVIEHALAHQLANKSEAAYQRGTLWPKRLALMDAWSDYCANGSSKVINLRVA
jgi:integrase